MKILHCIGNLSGGGAETQLSILAQSELSGIEQIVLSCQKLDTNSKVPTLFIEIQSNQNLLKKWLKVFKVLKKEKPDVIHIWLPAVFHIFFIPAIFFFKAKKVLGVRSVYQVDSFKRLLHWFLYILGGNIVANTHIEDQKGIYKWLFSKKKYHYIPNALRFEINNDIFHTKKNNYPFTSILFVGRLINDKNIETLFKALSYIEKSAWNLTVLGTGPEKENLIELAVKLNIQDRVSFEDYQKDIIQFYHQSDIFILPSTREGMPNVVFEAATFNNILILSDIPQHRRWFKHNETALFFNPLKPKELAECINTALSMDAIKKEQMNNEVIKFLVHLTKEKYTERYIKLYRNITN